MNAPLQPIRPFPRRLAAAFAAAVVAAILALPSPAHAAGLLIPVGGTDSMAIKNQKVSVHINNGIAVTTVDQVFGNKMNFPQEAVYRFPVPENGSVSNFSLWINGKEVVGEVLESKKARQIYDEITATRRDPGLLEQTNYKWFEMRVSPVPANGEQHIQLSYYQPADYDAGYLVYTYPLETTGVTKAELEGEFSVLVDVVSQIPMKRVYSPSHEKETLVRQATPQRYRAGVEIAKGRLDRDFVLACQLEREKTGIDLLASRRNGKQGYFMLTVTPSADLDKLAEPINYIFVLDVSGSMG
ncbi:MAG: VIT domain-containing protein, partial [Phycisphaerae bacterium]|nr:VIT domain-containing protein [Phycisphaerae bacterium]